MSELPWDWQKLNGDMYSRDFMPLSKMLAELPMKLFIYAAACWPLASIIVAVIMCRQVHKAKVREEVDE